MEPILLISKADFVPYVELSANLDAVKKLNTHIEHAQEFDLRPLIGDLLYYDLLKNSTDQKYLDLLNGKEYQVSGVDFSFKGLVPVIVHYATARLIPNLNSMVSATGFVSKLNDLSNPVEPKEISRAVTMYESLANGYWQKAKSFLDIHFLTYTLWERSNCSREGSRGIKSGARIYGLN